MKSNVFQLSQVIKNIHRSKFYQWHTHWRKGLLESLLSKTCGSFLFRQSEKTSGILWSVWVFYTYLEVMVIVWCDKMQIYRVKQRFKMLVVLSPLFFEVFVNKKEVLNYSFWIIFKKKTNLTVEPFHPLWMTLTAPKCTVKQFKRTKIVELN